MVKVLDLRVVGLDVDYDGIWQGRCGYYYIQPRFKVSFTLYVKYEIPRWTYHDKLVIKAEFSPAPSAFQYARILEKVVSNPSDESIVVEEKLSTDKITAVLSFEKMNRSGDKSFRIRVYPDTQPQLSKYLTVTFYWDATRCTVSNIRVEGLESAPPVEKPQLSVTDLRVDKTTITKGESVTVTATISNSGNADGTCVAELLIDGLLVTGKKITVPARSSVKVSFRVEDLRTGSHRVCVRI